jgi:hypothetical protein
MSYPPHPLGSPDPWDGLLLRIADQIAPLFQNVDSDPAYARKAAISAIGAYNPESRADIVNIGRILAFSMATLAALGIAAADDLPPAQKMRYFGRANALNRSAEQSERSMRQRRRDQLGKPTTDQPAKPQPATAPSANPPPPNDPAIDDPIINAAVEEAMAALQASVSQPAHNTTVPPIPNPPHQAVRLRPTASAQPVKALYKQSLLQRTAMSSGITAAPSQRPG